MGGCLCSFRRDWQTNKCSNNVLNVLPFIPKLSIHSKTRQNSPDSVRIQGPSKTRGSGQLYPVSSVKEQNRKGGKCKISRVLQSPVSCIQASPKLEAVIDLSRLNTFLLVEKFKMETPESIRTSLIPGDWVSSIDL